jgi:hypothetical protein
MDMTPIDLRSSILPGDSRTVDSNRRGVLSCMPMVLVHGPLLCIIDWVISIESSFRRNLLIIIARKKQASHRWPDAAGSFNLAPFIPLKSYSDSKSGVRCLEHISLGRFSRT